MARRGEAWLRGGLGCIAVFVIGGILTALAGGYFYLDLGGVAILFVLGGLAGLAVNWLYENGRVEGLAEAKRGLADGNRDGADGIEKPSGRRRVPTFEAPWGEETPATVADAIARITEVYWLRDYPEMRFHERGVTVTFRSRGVEDDRVLEIEASEETDSVKIWLRDDLGEVFAAAGSWRFTGSPNADQKQAFEFVESILMEDVVHTLTSDGKHLNLPAAELEARTADDPGLRVRSWNGHLDRNGAG